MTMTMTARHKRAQRHIARQWQQCDGTLAGMRKRRALARLERKAEQRRAYRETRCTRLRNTTGFSAKLSIWKILLKKILRFIRK
jgi:hypothetical protein